MILIELKPNQNAIRKNWVLGHWMDHRYRRTIAGSPSKEIDRILISLNKRTRIENSFGCRLEGQETEE
jgi:hypothetical protein